MGDGKKSEVFDWLMAFVGVSGILLLAIFTYYR